MRCLLLMFAAIALAHQAEAKEIRFADKELARESVLPIFDDKAAVKKRNIVTAGRISAGGYFGLNLAESFFSQMSYGIMGTYHFDEVRGINVLYNGFTDSYSSYTDQLQQKASTRLNLRLAPQFQYSFLVNYVHTTHYGKISLAKQIVSNLHLYGLGGGGVIAIGEKIYPALNIGLGQNYYFNPNWALQFDLRLLAYQGPNYLERKIPDTATETQTAASYSTTLRTSTILSVGLTYLFSTTFQEPVRESSLSLDPSPTKSMQEVDSEDLD